jgi:hypothetical protein
MRSIATTKKTLLLLGLAAAAAALVAGFATNSGSAARTPTRLAVVARDNSLHSGARSVPAGLVTLTFRNAGNGEHALSIFRLKHGVSLDRLVRVLDRNHGVWSPAIASARGAIPSLPPGTTRDLTTELTPGRYALVDYGANGGNNNFTRGLVMPLTVRKTKAEQARPPASVGKIVMLDFAFGIDLPARFSGKGVLRLENRGHELHEITLIRLNRGVSYPKAIAAVDALVHGKQVQPPGTPVELVGVGDPGWVGYMHVDLSPGRYLALCLIGDQKSGKLHSELGMTGRFTVS